MGYLARKVSHCLNQPLKYVMKFKMSHQLAKSVKHVAVFWGHAVYLSRLVIQSLLRYPTIGVKDRKGMLDRSGHIGNRQWCHEMACDKPEIIGKYKTIITYMMD